MIDTLSSVQPGMQPAPKHQIRAKRRLLALALLIFAELLLVSLSFDSYSRSLRDSGQWYAFLAYAGQSAKVLVAFFAALVLALWPRSWNHLLSLKASLAGYRYYYFIILQLLAFCVFFLANIAIFASPDADVPPSSAEVLTWLFSFMALGLFWVLSVAPWRYWLSFIAAEKVAFTFAAVIALLAWTIAQFAQSMWDPLSGLTFSSSAWLLGLFYTDIVVDASSRLLGAGDFIVNIAPVCSGYEGIGLVVLFTGLYLSIFRKEFRFPQALLLFPIGMVTIWAFNVLRIVLLISIGSSFSEAVAIGGFHSQAGWISFLLVSFGLLIAAHRLSFFCRQPISKAPEKQMSLPAALLLPFVVLMGSIILTMALAGDFVWLYPLRVLAVGFALFLGWKIYRFTSYRVRLMPVLAGVFVFLFWVALSYNDAEENLLFGEQLASAPLAASIFWLLFRFLGAVITVPLAEELLFRGYLFGRIERNQEIQLEGRIAFSWKTLLVTSVLFGILHSDLIAGTMAGLVYGWVRYKGNSVLDAVIAHGVTNLLLSVLVLTTGYWSLW